MGAYHEKNGTSFLTHLHATMFNMHYEAAKARALADKAGFYRFALPKVYGGQANPSSNLWMCAIRYHLASHPIYGGGVSLANDLQNEHSVVGNFPDVLMIHHFGNEEQRRTLIPARLQGHFRTTFGLTEPKHGSDATYMETRARPARGEYPPQSGHMVDGFVLDGAKKWQSGAHHCTHMLIFARTSGKPGSSRGITAFLVPRNTPGVESLAMNGRLTCLQIMHNCNDSVFVHVCGPEEVDSGLAIAQHSFTRTESAKQRPHVVQPNFALIGQSNMLDLETFLERRWQKIKPSNSNRVDDSSGDVTASHSSNGMGNGQIVAECGGHADGPVPTGSKKPWVEIEKRLSDKVAMCNYWANRLCCQAADRAIQIHGGNGYSRHQPFEHIYRHFRRYRITEGSEEIQMRKVAAYIFGYSGPKRAEFEKAQEQSKL
ncbi:LOW QUALITY PROTEIN: short-chain specific acyl-CoA dehydrogenase [Coccidioides immitis RMSCC 3703]|uniref:Short-chain specific acyl-CoA dehydrogenase n=1 Tax=Coccidioides immitis RMSCC 3703 TaxID=454286 RepID=A0A0J8TMT5_COCIT|nr:LOW QUALITY PROTEIN: short-chain specific acyl-CoA dehydrogenase [Coccidioides immitis RMSCC 3703]